MNDLSTVGETLNRVTVLPPDLRWVCDPSQLNFATTEDVEPAAGVVGQDTAVDALRFGLEVNAPGQNIFVRGLTGTGRMTLVSRLMKEIQPSCPLAPDSCYVPNFQEPDRPRLLLLPRGTAHRFAKMIEGVVEFLQDDLGEALSSESIRERRTALEDQAQAEMSTISDPFEKELKDNGLAMATVQVGQVSQPAILPVVEGNKLPPEQFEALREQGVIKEDDAKRIADSIAQFQKKLEEVSIQIQGMHQRLKERVRALYDAEARSMITLAMRDLRDAFTGSDVNRFLDFMRDDILENLEEIIEQPPLAVVYNVNVMAGHVQDTGCPMIIENSPTMQNLLGTIDREQPREGEIKPYHTMVRAGSILRADGGYLILEARDVLSEPGAWKVLVRTLRTGRLEIVPPDMNFPWMGPSIKPEPIPVNVKVVLLGDSNMYYLLDANDPDFPHLFKVLADFDSIIPRDVSGIERYAGVLSRIAKEEGLRPFDRTAVAALAEHGARIASRQDRLTTRFGRIADIAREAAFIATKKANDVIDGDHIRAAITNSKKRADLPSRRFREFVSDGTININVKGSEVGQVNGLAVIHAGPLSYGFPSRITATIGPGTAGTINIEREAALSGAIHTKGFYILGGLLRHLLRSRHPLAFDASVAFEQSYGGIDGDSASGAEMCCLISALTGLPLRQDLAMTGAIDQVGHVQAIGAVTEKIEGFFDTCRDIEMTGTQGVIVPRSNVRDLMLRGDVVEACEKGQFAVYGVETIQDALEVFMGLPAGELSDDGSYPDNTVLGIAVRKAREYWDMASPKRD